MLTWMYLSHNHTVTELIPNLGAVGTEVLTDNPANLPLERTQELFECDTVWKPEQVCKFWGTGKVFTLSDTSTYNPP